MSKEELQKFKAEQDFDILKKVDELMEASISINNQSMITFLNIFKKKYDNLCTTKEDINKEIELILNSDINDLVDIAKKIKKWQIDRTRTYGVLYLVIHDHNAKMLNRNVKTFRRRAKQ